MEKENNEPHSIFIPVDWGTHVVCKNCGERFERGLRNWVSHVEKCTHQFTEDADFEIIEPKQLPPTE